MGTFGGEDREEGVCIHRGGEWSDFDEREAAAIEEKSADACVRRADGIRTRQTRLGDVHVARGAKLPTELLHDAITESFRAIAPKRAVKQLDAATATGGGK